MHRVWYTLIALSVSQFSQTVAADTPTCIVSLDDSSKKVLITNDTSKPTCEGSVSANFAVLGCTSAADAACLCAAAGFTAGILQCSQPTCGATGANVQSYLNGAFCQGESTFLIENILLRRLTSHQLTPLLWPIRLPLPRLLLPCHHYHLLVLQLLPHKYRSLPRLTLL